jgi:hypothetical protein
MPARRIVRDVNEAARDVARALAKTEAFAQSRRDRKKVEMLFAHLKRILRLGRLRLRGPSGAQFEFTLAAIARICVDLRNWWLSRRLMYRPRALHERSVRFVASKLRSKCQFQCVRLPPVWAGGNNGLASASKDRRDGQYVLHTRLLQQNRPRADINRCTNRHRTAETFGQILSWLLETVRLRSAPELAVGARAEN